MEYKNKVKLFSSNLIIGQNNVQPFTDTRNGSAVTTRFDIWVNWDTNDFKDLLDTYREKSKVRGVQFKSINMRVEDKYKDIFEFTNIQEINAGLVKPGDQLSFDIRGVSKSPSTIYRKTFSLEIIVKNVKEAINLSNSATEAIQVGTILCDVSTKNPNYETSFEQQLNIPIYVKKGTTRFIQNTTTSGTVPANTGYAVDSRTRNIEKPK